ncbi:uncharacterized protein LOC102706000 isoform X2 [Oryza brachyantha]|uniref:Phytosulfokine-beta n=1 Tax=Oryza brachyantha TaxID=4533 RepID=J3M1Y0_ORYBR|nr:uncharacterized protein LOC102706000 isoform X2 [Oryza brachyantha]
MHRQMRSSFLLLASLVLLLLATRAHGIRPDRKLLEAINSKDIMGDSKAELPHETSRLLNNQRCTSDEHCNSGKAKRPLVQAGAAAEQKQPQQHQSPERSDDAKQEEEEALRQPEKKTSPSSSTTYPDILDIAGMDYSPATRKPPIHN